MKYICPLLLTSLLFGCSSESVSRLQEKIDDENDVSRLGVPHTFTNVAADLPKRGQSVKTVWWGNWFPYSKGGTLETMRKYDRATKGFWAAAWEEGIVKYEQKFPWAGHCNGLSAAGINEEPPLYPVTYNGVEFSVEDVQALLVEKWQGDSRVSLVGQRCPTKWILEDNGRITEPGCRDMNAGSLHVLLANMLGIHHKPFIIDISALEEIWNYPVVGFESVLVEIDEGRAKELTNISQQPDYVWNPEATEFTLAKTDLRLSTGKYIHLEYVLEKVDGRIIGGEWIGPYRRDHPDFAWTQTEAETPNPYLDVKVIDEIARLSRIAPK